jgi:uncharacterized RDD family membrane protein YckC
MQEREHADAGPRHAGFQIRLVASLVDIVALAAPAYLVVSVFFGFDWLTRGLRGESVGRADLVITVLLAAVTILLWVNWDGRTPGKKLTRIHIASYPGYGRLSYWTALVRSLVAALSVLPLFLGYVVIAVMVGRRKDKRGYHDLLAKTCVIHDEPN